MLRLPFREDGFDALPAHLKGELGHIRFLQRVDDLRNVVDGHPAGFQRSNHLLSHDLRHAPSGRFIVRETPSTLFNASRSLSLASTQSRGCTTRRPTALS